MHTRLLASFASTIPGLKQNARWPVPAHVSKRRVCLVLGAMCAAVENSRCPRRAHECHCLALCVVCCYDVVHAPLSDVIAAECHAQLCPASCVAINGPILPHQIGCDWMYVVFCNSSAMHCAMLGGVRFACDFCACKWRSLRPASVGLFGCGSSCSGFQCSIFFNGAYHRAVEPNSSAPQGTELHGFELERYSHVQGSVGTSGGVACHFGLSCLSMSCP